MYVYMYRYMHTIQYIHLDLIPKKSSSYLHVYTYIYICVCIYMDIHICIYIYTYSYIYTNIQLHKTYAFSAQHFFCKYMGDPYICRYIYECTIQLHLCTQLLKNYTFTHETDGFSAQYKRSSHASEIRIHIKLPMILYRYI